jgi:hypothetical protein
MTRYIVLRDGEMEPSLFAMTNSAMSLEWLRKLLVEASVYEQVELKEPSAGKIEINKQGELQTTMFDMEVRANAQPEDGDYIDSELQSEQPMKFLVTADSINILNKWVIPDGNINSGFLKGHELSMGTFECVFGPDNKYHVVSVEYQRQLRRITTELENILNTVPVCCCPC